MTFFDHSVCPHDLNPFGFQTIRLPDPVSFQNISSHLILSHCTPFQSISPQSIPVSYADYDYFVQSYPIFYNSIQSETHAALPS